MSIRDEAERIQADPNDHRIDYDMEVEAFIVGAEFAKAGIAAGIRTLPDGDRPLRRDAETATDYANDIEWAAMRAEAWEPES